jgi:hypothetical protein
MAKPRAIADADWHVTVQLHVAGEPTGAPIEMHYTDSFVKDSWHNAGILIAGRMDEHRTTLKRPTKARKKP